MKKILLISLLIMNGLFASEEIMLSGKGPESYIFIEGKATNITAEAFHKILKQNKKSQTINNYNGYSGWSLVGCFAGGVIVTVGAAGLVGYLGYNHVKPELIQLFDRVDTLTPIVTKGIGVAGAFAKGLGQAALEVNMEP